MTRWPSYLLCDREERDGHLIGLWRTYLLCHRSFFNCKKTTLNVSISNNNERLLSGVLPVFQNLDCKYKNTCSTYVPPICCTKVIKRDLSEGYTKTSYMTLNKKWHRPTSKMFANKLPYSLLRAARLTRMAVACLRPALSAKRRRTNHAPISFDHRA